jgi:putative transposase
MPDHVHMIFTPYEGWSLSEILKRVKGNSSRLINLAIGRRGPLWQDESFDRIVRESEDLQKKCEYVAENPVRAGLCTTVDDYPWVWREWIDGKKKQE